MNNSKKSGFTLLELMVVVAIIGILASMAIPSYLTLVARAKKSEAKMNLASIYTAETMYYTENMKYSDNFYDLGWNVQGNNLFQYKIGLGTTPCAGHSLSLGCDSISPSLALAVPGCTFVRLTGPINATDARDMFVATAEGNIDPGDPDDGWSISQNKDLFEDCDEIM